MRWVKNPVLKREENAQVEDPYGAAKRFSKTGTGKIKRHQTKTRHILTSKSPKVKRKLGKTLMVSDGDYKKVARMIPTPEALRAVLVFEDSRRRS